MWRATFKSLLAKKLRFSLTALSVVLGVGFVAGTFVLTDTMNAAFDQLFTQAAGTSDVTVRSVSAFTTEQAGPGGGASSDREPIPASVLPLVKSVTGVALVGGDVQGTAQMVDPATDEPIGGFGPPTIGSNWNDVSGGTVTIREGVEPTGPDDVAIDAATAKKYGFAVGQQVQILFAAGDSRKFTISGIVSFGDADNLAGATLAIFDTTTAQTVLGKEGVFDSISVVGDDRVAASELRADIQEVLPEGVEAVTSATVADEQSQALKEGLGFFRIALLVFACIALFVGAFIIFNTFSIIVAQRTRELALLRALGASRVQVMASVVVEALLVGLFAAVVGIVAGIGIAMGLKGLLGAFGIDLPSTSIQLLPRTIVVSLLVGTVVTVVASVLPARRAARVAPIQALRESGDTVAPSGTLRRRLILGVTVTALGAAALASGLFGGGSKAGVMVGLGAAMTFIGIAVLSPLAARPIAGALGAPARRLSMQGKLGRENAMRNPRRTASTAAALMIGLGLVSMVAILSASLKASFDTALTETLKADYMLTTSSFTSFGSEAANKVRDLPEVAAVSEFRQNGFRIDGNTAFLTAAEPATLDAVVSIDLLQGDLAELSRPDTIMVHEDIAVSNGWAVGDEIPAQFATVGDAPLTLVGIYGDNRLAGDYLISTDTYATFYTEQLDSFVLVKASSDVSPGQAKAAIEAAVRGFPNVQVQDQAAFREQQAGFIDQLLGLVTALLLMSILIALFGIVNTLGLSIYERTRELGLLRAVGMSRRQVKRMIRWEAVIIAIFGAVLGIAIGVLFGWALQQALADEGVTALKIPVAQLVFYLVFAGIAGVLAAILPARRAAKLNVLDAISYE
ncbi:MAG: FtsX-like permease family protein [Actinomycetota bacterium]